MTLCDNAKTDVAIFCVFSIDFMDIGSNFLYIIIHEDVILNWIYVSSDKILTLQICFRTISLIS